MSKQPDARAPNARAMERFMRGNTDAQGQQDFEDATTPEKASQDEVRYQRTAAHCDECQFYEDPGSCQKVDGEIDPGGYCSLFEAGEEGDQDEDTSISGASEPPLGVAIPAKRM